MAQRSIVRGVKTTIGKEGAFNFVQYHNTKVISWNGTFIFLTSGGWRTRTTLLRIDQTRHQFDLEFSVFQKNFNWFVNYNNKIYPFEDNMMINRLQKQVMNRDGINIAPL